MAMKLECPECGAADVQRLAMIYQHGTATSVSNSATLADVSGHLGVAGTVTSGKHQSLLAQQAAPPPPKSGSGCSFLGAVGTLMVGGLVILIAAADTSPDRTGELVFGGLLVLLAVIWLAQVKKAASDVNEYNSTVYPRLREKWERTWLCLRCGHRFEAKL